MTGAAVALVVAVVALLVPMRRIPSWVAVATVAAVAIATGVVDIEYLDAAFDGLWEPLAFLAFAVPVAVMLDDVGFFGAVAERFADGKRLGAGLWALAAAVTVVFNLDAAVVLLTPLYVRIAHRHGRDPVVLGFIPALTALVSSSLLPVSNLTNLIVAGPLELSTWDFVVRAGPATVAATAVGWWAYRRWAPPAPPAAGTSVPAPDVRALRIGIPVVGWLLVGFGVGDVVGVPVWAVAAAAAVALAVVTRGVPWRHVPVRTIVLVVSVASLALGAAAGVDVESVLETSGTGGHAAVFVVTALAANAVNNLPTVLVLLPGLEAHPDHVWSVVLGANIGPVLWVSGSLSTMLWQQTMQSLGYPVSARRYASVGVRVGVPAMAAALAVHLVGAGSG